MMRVVQRWSSLHRVKCIGLRLLSGAAAGGGADWAEEVAPSSSSPDAKQEEQSRAGLVRPGLRISVFADGDAIGDPIATGRLTKEVADNIYMATFDCMATTAPVVEVGNRVVVKLRDREPIGALVAKVHGNGNYAVLLDNDAFESTVPREAIIHSEGRPKFLSSDRYKDLVEWVREAGVDRRADVESTACILFHRGWRKEKLYLLEAVDVHCLSHLNKSVRMGLLEKAEWELEQFRHIREVNRELMRETQWRYFLTKYSGVFSAIIAVCGVISIFTWNFKNYQKQTRDFQLSTAVHKLSRKVTRKMQSRSASAHLIERPEQVERLLRLVKGMDTDHPRVVLLTGQRGCGKSQLCRAAVAAANRCALFVDVREVDDPIRSVVKSLGVGNIDVCGDMLDFISDACLKARERLGFAPIIIFKLSEESNVVKRGVYAAALAIACDRRVAHVIIEAEPSSLSCGVTHLPRIDTYYIPEFTRPEAIEYVGRRVDPMALENFMETVGTNPNDLDEFVAAIHQRGMDGAAFASNKLVAAMQTIKTKCLDSNGPPKLTNAPTSRKAPTPTVGGSWKSSVRFTALRDLAAEDYEVGAKALSECIDAERDELLQHILTFNYETERWVFASRLWYTAVKSLS